YDVLAVHVRQPKIKHNHVGRALRHERERMRTRRRFRHLIAVSFQGRTQNAQNWRFIIDNENRGRLVHSAASTFACAGKRISTRAPLPPEAGLIALISPPNASIRPRATESPSPTPAPRRSLRPRKKRSKTRSRSVAGMPAPSSSIDISTLPLSAFTLARMVDPAAL